MADRRIRITVGTLTAETVLNDSLGRVLGDPTVFKPVRSGATVHLERA